MLAVVQPPITGSLLRVRQPIGTSSASVVTFLSPIGVRTRRPVGPSGFRFTRSNTWPEVHREAFLALADEHAPGCRSRECATS